MIIMDLHLTVTVSGTFEDVTGLLAVLVLYDDRFQLQYAANVIAHNNTACLTFHLLSDGAAQTNLWAALPGDFTEAHTLERDAYMAAAAADRRQQQLRDKRDRIAHLRRIGGKRRR